MWSMPRMPAKLSSWRLRPIKQQNIMSPVGPRTNNNCAGKDQQQFSSQSTIIHEIVASQLPSSEDMSTVAEPPRLAGIPMQCMLKTVTNQWPTKTDRGLVCATVIY
jgi:hypothetical protein